MNLNPYGVYLLDIAAKLILRSDWPTIKAWVQAVDQEFSHVSGAERKQFVLNKATVAGIKISTMLLDFAIQAALIWARSRSTS